MKRKIFSKLLMGALLIASVSSFVSCKDYDDDIDNLQKQIDAAALKAELTNLQSTLATQIAAAQAAADKAAQAAAAAQKTADAAATAAALDAVKTAAEKAGTDAAKALTDAANAQTAADAAKAAAEAAKYDDTAVTAAAAKAQATADNAVAAAGKAQEAADAAQKAADEAKAAAAAAKYDDAALKAAVEKAQAAADAAKAAAEAAQKKADAAQAKADAAAADAASKATAKDIEDAIAKATEAINAATEAKIAAAVAKAVADLTAKIPADQSEAIADLTSKLNTLAANQASVATAEALQNAVTELEGKIAAAAAASGDAASAAAAIAEVSAATGTLKAAIDEIYTIVTSVEIVASYSYGIIPGGFQTTRPNTGFDISFIHGKQVTDEPFGNNEDKFFQFAEADQIKFKTGADIRTDQSILIRVNPTNATFTKEQIQLVDSKGRDLNDYIEILDPYRYTGLITRSTDNSGLWVIPVKVKDGAKKGEFNRYVYDGGNLVNDEIPAWSGGRQILYAVAIKNEATTENRYVASTYDICTGWNDYVPANYFNVFYSLPAQNVNGLLFNHKNRWGNIRNNNTNAYEDGILGENNVDRSFDNPELTWIIPAIPAPVAKSDNVMKDGGNVWTWNNATVTSSPFDDRRLWNSIIEVENGETIILSNINSWARRYYWDYNNNGVNGFDNSVGTSIEYFYVTFDLGNAIESRPSEYNAWKDYKFDGLNKMTHSSEDLAITFNDPTAIGDYIGFRVYAVNYDGTLVDPDGRAFYVHIKGKPAEHSGVTVSITANTNLAQYNAITTLANRLKKNAGSAKITQSFVDGAVVNNPTGTGRTSAPQFEDDVYFGINTGNDWNVANGNPWEESGSWASDNIKVHYQLLDKDGKLATNWKDIKSVNVSVDNPGLIADGQTLPAIRLWSNDGNAVGNNMLNELYIYVKKEMPTTAAKVVWRESLQPDADNLLVVYPRPWDAATGKLTWNTIPTNVPHMEKDLTQYVDNKEEFEDWVISKKAGLGDNAITMNATNGWSAVSESSKIGKTYDSYITYIYPQLSTYYDQAARTWRYAQDYTIKAWEGKVKYADVIDLFTYGLAQYTYTDDATKKGSALNVKWLEIENGTSVTHFWGDSKTAGAFATNVNAFLPTMIVNTTSDSNKRKAVNAGIVESAAYGNSIALDWSTISNSTKLAGATYDKNIYPGGISASLSGGNITSLITVAYNSTSQQFTIRRFVNTDGSFGDVPTADVNGTITVTGIDSYGVKHKIVDIPITLRYNK